MKKIGIVGSFGSGNLGDEACWIAIKRFLESKDPRYLYETQIFQWSHPYSFTNHHTRAFGLLSDPEIDYINSSFEALIISGGGIIGANWGFTCTGLLPHILDKLTIPIYCISISAEDDEYKPEQISIIKRLYEKSKLFTVRDVHSYKVMTKLIGRQVEITPDVVTCLIDAEEFNMEIKPSDIITTTANQCLTNEHLNWMKQLFKRLPMERIKYVPFTCIPNDIIACQQYTCKVAFELYHPAIMQTIIRKCNFVIAGRLHAAVFAANTGTPFFAINYHPKVKSFCDSIGYKHYWPRGDSYKKDVVNYGFDFMQFGVQQLIDEIINSINNPEKPKITNTSIGILERVWEKIKEGEK